MLYSFHFDFQIAYPYSTDRPNEGAEMLDITFRRYRSCLFPIKDL